MSIRTERVARLIQREVASLLNTTFYETSQTMLTVTGARVTPDLSMAYIYVSSLGKTKAERQGALQRLEDSTPRIRHALAGRIRHQVRKIPNLRFFLDESAEEAAHIERLLDQVKTDPDDAPEPPEPRDE